MSLPIESVCPSVLEAEVVAEVDRRQPDQVVEGLGECEALAVQVDVAGGPGRRHPGEHAVPPFSTHSESSPSENTRLRKRLKYSSWIRLFRSSDGSACAALFAASLIALSTPAAVE